MGSQQSHEKSVTDGGSGANTPRGGSRRGTVTVPRSDSGSDIQESHSSTSMVPIEKLAKILAHKSQKEDGINGVTEKIFVQCLFPSYAELGAHVFQHMHRSCTRHKHSHLSTGSFRTQSERLLAMLDLGHIVEVYLRMYSSNPEEDSIASCEFRALLRQAARLSFDYYPSGSTDCPMLEKTLSAIVDGCFHNKSSHTVGFVVRWSMDTCHRLILPLHRYVVHVMSSAHRLLDAGQAAEPPRPAPSPSAPAPPAPRDPAALVSLSTAWLIAALAAPIYSAVKPPAGGVALSACAWASRLVCAVPAHWALLYSAATHGLAANRLVYHVTNYRSPTVMVLSAGSTPDAEGSDNSRIVCAILCGSEWRDCTRYFGGPFTHVLMLYPTVEILETGENLVYLNVQTRGYPRGLRAGKDPRNPVLYLDEDYSTLTVAGDTHPLHDIEVWGCGDAAIRDSQLDVKKWQVKEAERQRQIKLSPADWIEHPDRYLLELAGRPQYNNSAS